ncbi:MAG: hypothetical protein ACI31C_08975 [Muribaculaceae bacterium]
MRVYTLIIIVSAILATSTPIRAGEPMWSDLRVTASMGGTVQVSVTINPSRCGLSSNSTCSFTPVLSNSDSTHMVEMGTVTVAGHNSRIRILREPWRIAPDAVLLGTEDPSYTLNASLPYEPWMDISTVSIKTVRTGCCRQPKEQAEQPVAKIDLQAPQFVTPEFNVEVPAAEVTRLVTLSGSANVEYVVNRTEVNPRYRNNPEELAKIIATIDTARNNADATITSITIKGYASPEGTYSNNERLSRGRSISLTEYVKAQYDELSDSIFHSDYEPEDWAGFRDSIAASTLTHRAEILEIIDSALEPDAKDATIKRRFPEEYKYIIKEIYPSLRHSEYVVEYLIRENSALVEARREMRERAIALNAAVQAISNSDYDAAEAQLAEVCECPERTYLRGIILARQGNYGEARPLLESVADNIPQAVAALQSIEIVQSHETIIYSGNN